MKKLVLIMMALMASFSVYAQEVNNTDENNEVAVANYTTVTRKIKLNEVVYPYVIDVEAPVGTVLRIDGPTDPLLQTWYVQNGRLFIELYEDDLCDVRPGNTHYLHVYSTGGGITIELIIE